MLQVEIIPCPSTRTGINQQHPQLSFHANDAVHISFTFTDQSTNGSFIGDVKLPRGSPYPITAKLIPTDHTGSSKRSQINSSSVTTTFLAPVDERAGYSTSFDIISLGKPKAAPDPAHLGVVQKPVFAFGTYLLLLRDLADPLNSPNELDSSSFIGFLPNPVSRCLFIGSSSTTDLEQSVPQSSMALGKTKTEQTYHPVSGGSGAGAAVAELGWREKYRSLEVVLKDRESEVFRLNQSLQEKIDQINEVRVSNESLKSRVVELEEQVEAVQRREQSRQRELSQQLADAGVEQSLTARKATALQQQLAACQTERDAAAAERERLSEELERLELKRKQLSDELNLCRNRIEDLESERTTSQAQLARARAEASELAGKGEAQRAEFRELESRHQALEAQNRSGKALQNDLMEQLHRAEQAQSETLAHYEKTAEELEAMNNELRAKKSQAESLTTMATSLIDDISDRIGSFEKSLRELQENDKSGATGNGKQATFPSGHMLRTPSPFSLNAPPGSGRIAGTARLTSTLLRPPCEDSDGCLPPSRKRLWTAVRSGGKQVGEDEDDEMSEATSEEAEARTPPLTSTASSPREVNADARTGSSRAVDQAQMIVQSQPHPSQLHPSQLQSSQLQSSQPLMDESSQSTNNCTEPATKQEEDPPTDSSADIRGGRKRRMSSSSVGGVRPGSAGSSPAEDGEDSSDVENCESFGGKKARRRSVAGMN